MKEIELTKKRRKSGAIWNYSFIQFAVTQTIAHIVLPMHDSGTYRTEQGKNICS